VIAAMMHCPVILFFGIYRGGNRYEIYFEKFADEIVLNREHRPKTSSIGRSATSIVWNIIPDSPLTIGSTFIPSGIDQ
jgi:hypothetical protein